ncbi:MAG: hypothetical protein KZQ71_20150, partial [Candidatus Thiodiazotropha sp. (ex Lucinoma aequizonata)]|nr:hypothetical protein [Candidatus Thiodiazotropha sp. (ex Lucinoma aequizonata)]
VSIGAHYWPGALVHQNSSAAPNGIVIFFRGLNGRGQSLLSYRLVSDGNYCLFQRGHGQVGAKAEDIKQIEHGVKGESLDFCVCQVGHSGLLHPKALSCF